MTSDKADFMKQKVNNQVTELRKIVCSYHFWIILSLIGLIAVPYYTWQDWFPWFWHYFVFEYINYTLGIPFIVIPFLYASIVFWWRGSALVWILSMIVLIPLLISYHPGNIGSVLRNIAFLFVPIAVVSTIALQLYWRERQKEIMTEREKERQVYMNQILQAQENERQRIAQELHDDTTQTLVALASNMSTLLSKTKRKAEPIQIKDISAIREVIVGTIEELRRLCVDLRPAILDTMGLMPAVNWLVKELQHESSIKTKLVVNSELRLQNPTHDVIIFRIIQEALNNIRKHSVATEASVILDYMPERLNITIKDNGRGFVLPVSFSKLSMGRKLGLIGIRQRVEALSGTFDIKSEIGKGSTLSIELPI